MKWKGRKLSSNILRGGYSYYDKELNVEIIIFPNNKDIDIIHPVDKFFQDPTRLGTEKFYKNFGIIFVAKILKRFDEFVEHFGKKFNDDEAEALESIKREIFAAMDKTDTDQPGGIGEMGTINTN